MIKEYFQHHMPDNVCFGCGIDNPNGLQIKSYWEGEEAHCLWQSKEHFHGWEKIMNGGILATLIDCHCMGTAMAAAYKMENRALDSEPYYRYATGTLTVKYLKPTSNVHPVLLKAKVLEIKGRKTTMACEVWSQDHCTVQAEVIAIRVAESNQDNASNPFLR